jgi:hypothetical protein
VQNAYHLPYLKSALSVGGPPGRVDFIYRHSSTASRLGDDRISIRGRERSSTDFVLRIARLLPSQLSLFASLLVGCRHTYHKALLSASHSDSPLRSFVHLQILRQQFSGEEALRWSLVQSEALRPLCTLYGLSEHTAAYLNPDILIRTFAIFLVPFITGIRLVSSSPLHPSAPWISADC